MDNTINKSGKKSRIRPGRGISAGRGKTAGRGTKGQKSRAGHNIPKQFEGGQSNLALRLPKVKGFKSHQAKSRIITLNDLASKFKAGETVNTQSLINAGLLSKNETAKILANGSISIYLEIDGIMISNAAKDILDKNKSSKSTKTDKIETEKKAKEKTSK